jgi:hypothetical protein
MSIGIKRQVKLENYTWRFSLYIITMRLAWFPHQADINS